MTAEGATALLFGEIASKLVGVVGSIVLIRLLVSPAIYAPIAAATTLPGLVMLGDLTGVNTAVTRTLSYSKREGDSETIWSSYWVAILVKFLTGAILSVVAFLLAQPIATLLGKQSVESYLLIASGLPIVWTLQVNVKSTLLSLGRARAYSWLYIVNEILLSFAPIPAVLLGYGAIGALIAMVIANFAYLGVGLAVSTKAVLDNTEKQKRKITYRATAKRLVRFGLPLGLSNSFSTFVGQVINLIILRFVSLNSYGLYSVALSAAGLMNSISDPIISITFPVYSRIKSLQEKEVLQTVYRQSVRYSALIILPFSLFFIVFGRPFLTLFFGVEYSSGGIFLTGLSLFWLMVGMGWTKNLLTSQGYSKYTGTIGILTSLIGVAIAITIVPTLGLLAYVLLFNLSFMPGYILMVNRAKSDLGVPPPYGYVKRIYLALLLSALASVGFLFLNLAPVVEVVGGAFVVVASFVFFAAIVRALTRADPVNLRNMISSQPMVAKIANPLISIIARVVKFLQPEKSSLDSEN